MCGRDHAVDGAAGGSNHYEFADDDHRASCADSDAGPRDIHHHATGPSCRVGRDVPGTIQTANRSVATALGRRGRLAPA